MGYIIFDVIHIKKFYQIDPWPGYFLDFNASFLFTYFISQRLNLSLMIMFDGQGLIKLQNPQVFYRQFFFLQELSLFLFFYFHDIFF